jgi:presenilin-like A22 family membrane protease
MPPGFKASDVIQCVGISFGLSGTMIFLSYLRICGYAWATIASLVLTIAGMVVVPILAILDVIPSFETAYEGNRYFDYINHGQVFMLGLMQSVLLGVSLLCDACRKRRIQEADIPPWSIN